MVQLIHSIGTQRLILRRFERRDLADLAAIFQDESVNRYLYSDPRTREQTLEALEKRLAADQAAGSDNVLNVAVELRESQRVIGDFMLHWHDNEHRQGEIGGSLHPAYHGMGFATEIYAALLEIAFNQYELHRVLGRCDARNAASIRSLEKAGLHQEAHFVENEYVKGEWTDEIVLAVLRRDWISTKDIG
ncbi:MAG: GNAT family N-acetyltransferase [Acidimicrobiales bacterium]